MAVGRALGFVNTRIILFVFFYLILTPAGLVLRWLGKDPMRRSFEPRIETYRIPREARDGSHMRHQF